jgi:hypothetical protein
MYTLREGERVCVCEREKRDLVYALKLGGCRYFVYVCVCVCVYVCNIYIYIYIYTYIYIGDGSVLQVVDTQNEQGPFSTPVQAVGAAQNVGGGSVVCGGEKFRHQGRAHKRYCGGDAGRAM